MNMVVLSRTRKRRVAGEIFVYQMRSEPSIFRFGRVIRTDARVGPMENVNLVYLYKNSSPSCSKIPELAPNNLLVPPEFINDLPWSKGYFQTVAVRELLPSDILEEHCFFWYSRQRYVDEYGNEVPQHSTGVGQYALASYRTIDDRISDALGIPRSVD